ncbi:hypothetical protein ACFGVR_19435 [Mucilaginibacter sp. AW1-3]
MEAFETTLTGSDGNIAGVVTQLSKEAYQFISIDGALHLTVTKNEDGKWIRLAGSEPYFSGWVDELIEKVAAQPKAVRPTQAKTVTKKPTPVTSEKATAVKKSATASATVKKKAIAAPPVKKTKAKPDTDKKTTVAASASKKAKVSSAATKGK